MSFAHDTKKDLITLSEASKHDCCKRAELYGILFGAGVFDRQKCKLVTTCEPLAEFVIDRLAKLWHIEGNLYVTEKKSGEDDERRSSKITISQKKELERLFSLLHYEPDEPISNIKLAPCKYRGCKPSFLRGVFMSAGTITDPTKGYHLEMTFLSAEFADSLSRFMSELDEDIELIPKRMTRKNEEVLYFKDSASIENFLGYIGANNAMFSLMNAKIEREIRSDANRLANSELANIGKTVAAATDQLAAIRRLESNGLIASLPDELRQTAMLRLENPDATLLTLAGLHTPPITKSGVNHRLKKLVAIAENGEI